MTEAIVVLLVVIVFGLMSIERRIEREVRRSRMSEVDREMDDLNPNGFS
jgi:hypothetical protein